MLSTDVDNILLKTLDSIATSCSVKA